MNETPDAVKVVVLRAALKRELADNDELNKLSRLQTKRITDMAEENRRLRARVAELERNAW